MKKTLIIALAGMMLLAFTQCGGSKSKEFQDNKELLDKMEKAIKSSNSCEEMEDAVFEVAMSIFGNSHEYTDDERMTAEEEKELEELSNKLDETYMKKAKQLGCEGAEDLGNSNNSSDWNLDDLNDAIDDLNDLSRDVKDAKRELEDAFGGLF